MLRHAGPLLRCSGPVFLLLLALGCPAKDDPTGAALLSQVRQTLAERQRRLSSYHLAGESKEADAVASHAFFFRAPNKMRGLVLHPAQLEWVWDGAQLARLEPMQKRFSTFPMKLPADKAAMFLTTTFAPFVNEGFRTPLMPGKGVKAVRVKHPHGPEAVELTVELGPQLTLTYLLRWPTGDFLGRRTQNSAQRSELTVEEELCDAALKLCVPRVTSQTLDGKLQLTTRLSTIELNAGVPADDFSPKPPEGWTTEVHEVVETD